ncbi:MAG: hypothetical protein VKN13_02335 [Cyanobacteriota bacterium]|nr:hypothetical protein [Cyanobacteriota bacterium]
MVALIPPARRSGLALLAAAVGLVVAAEAAPAQATCRFLMPIGGGAEPVVTKRISPDGLLRRNNWNTDFAVDRTYARYRINLESASSEPGVFPVAAFLRFSDNTDLRVVDANPRLTPGQRLVFGPFPSVPGKRTTIVNVRVGATTMPGSTGFSYRVSVEGCT